MTQPSDHQEEPETTTQAKNIVVPLGVAIGFTITVLAAVIGGTITLSWWGSKVSYQLETLVKQGDVRDVGAAAMAIRMTAVELWKNEVSATGTPTMARETAALKVELEKMSQDFEIYKATNKRP